MHPSQNLLVAALEVAHHHHKGQLRKGLLDPYVTHCIRVGLMAGRYQMGPEAVAAGFLHDVVEDTPLEIEDLEAAGFPPRVVTLVRLLSKWWPDDAPAEEKAEQKPIYYARIREDPDAVDLKLIDRTDNLRDMVRLVEHPHCSRSQRKWAQRYQEKTLVEIGPLASLSTRPRIAAAFLGQLATNVTALLLHPPDGIITP